MHMYLHVHDIVYNYVGVTRRERRGEEEKRRGGGGGGERIVSYI